MLAGRFRWHSMAGGPKAAGPSRGDTPSVWLPVDRAVSASSPGSSLVAAREREPEQRHVLSSALSGDHGGRTTEAAMGEPAFPCALAASAPAALWEQHHAPISRGVKKNDP